MSGAVGGMDWSEYTQIRRFVELGTDGALAFMVGGATEVAAVAGQLRREGFRVESVDVAARSGGWGVTVARRVRVAVDRLCADLVVVTGFDAVRTGQAVTVLDGLNLNRDAIIGRGCPVLIVAPGPVIDRFARDAPDLWSVRSHVFDFTEGGLP